MRIKFYSSINSRPKSELIVIPFVQSNKKAKIAIHTTAFDKSIAPVLKSGDFSAANGEVALIYESKGKDKRIAMVGLGEEKQLTTESIRRAYSSIVKQCRKYKIQEICMAIPELAKDSEAALALAEGVFLTNYVHGHGKSTKESKLLTQIHLIGADRRQKKQINDAFKVAQSVYFTRDLINENADKVTPHYLSLMAKKLAKRHSKVTATIFDKKRIIKEKMELLLCVNRGSAQDPAFILLKYRGDPKAKEHTVLVGKGVTYDTGGLSLKPSPAMVSMRCDMGGAATVLGAIDAIASLGLKVNVTAVVPATENGIDALSYKPGDVYGSYAGKTVEIGNTDAEGRLILADALAYASKKLKPTRIIDFATLTGAIVIALGRETSGLMSNDDKLSEALSCAGKNSSETVWRLPLLEAYRKQIKSDIADLKNVGSREASAITAAMFLSEFVGQNIPWAHIDIAGTAFLEKEDGYLPKNATGVGVRLIVSLLNS